MSVVLKRIGQGRGGEGGEGLERWLVWAGGWKMFVCMYCTYEKAMLCLLT